MKRFLTWKETITITSMLFGLFFGAGNLIFPIYMGQLAGYEVWKAAAGFLITGVGLPLLGVAALGISKSSGLAELSARVGHAYSYFFTCALYLTIGPFFAIPRCATVSFEVGIAPVLPENVSGPLPLAAFSLLFFLAALWFSLRPGNILTWIGKILNPLFLLTLGGLIAAAFLSPMGPIGQTAPEPAYASNAFFAGFLEGYNTMDALAGLAFGIIVVTVIRDLGVKDPGDVAANTVRAGVFSSILMAVIYLAITVVGSQSRGLFPVSKNGGEAFALVAEHYFGRIGAAILAAAVIFACLKTAIGLVTSCAETFVRLFPGGPGYRVWTILFCAVSFLIANLGLNSIIAFSLPVLLFLYPLAITLIALSLGGRLFHDDLIVYRFVTGFTLAAAALDFFHALPDGVTGALHLTGIVEFLRGLLPFSALGLGWVLPAGAGLIAGLFASAFARQRRKRDRAA